MQQDEQKKNFTAEPPDTASDAASPSATPPGQAPEGGRIGFLSRINKRILYFGILALLALVLFVVAFMQSFVAFADTLNDIIAPLIIGGIIAYLCAPILEFYEHLVFKRMRKGNIRRGISLALTVITAFAIVALVLLMMIPELINSFTKLLNNSNAYINDCVNFLQGIIDWLNARLPMNVNISDVQTLMNDIFGNAEKWMDKLTEGDNLEAMGGTLLDILMEIFTIFKNLVIGIFIAFYLLASKEKRTAQIAKFRAAVFTESQDKKLGEFIKLTDHCFGGFIFGKIIDSLVIGVLTFILMTIFKVSEYNLLIATFVGLTNVIPVFGPFIGAIPSAFIILISNPSKTFLFILLIFIIQQIDGNIIGPKILGDNTGISSLSVIIAITVCGAIWGIPGMIIGVPLFAVIIEWIKRLLEMRLTEKGKETDTAAYYPPDAVGNAEKDLYYEHAGLLYTYEHSNMKPRVERVKRKIFEKPKKANKDNNRSKDATDK